MSTPNHSPLLWLTLRVFPPGGNMVRRTQNGTYKICPGSLLTMLGLKPWMHKSAGDFYESLLSWNECNLSRKKKKGVFYFFSTFFFFLPEMRASEVGDGTWLFCSWNHYSGWENRQDEETRSWHCVDRETNAKPIAGIHLEGPRFECKLQERPRSSKSKLGRWWQRLLEFRSLGPCKSRCKG